MRKPTQNYIFNEQNNNGLSSLIIGRTTMSEAITLTEIENLDLLTAALNLQIHLNELGLKGSKN